MEKLKTLCKHFTCSRTVPQFIFVAQMNKCWMLFSKPNYSKLTRVFLLRKERKKVACGFGKSWLSQVLAFAMFETTQATCAVWYHMLDHSANSWCFKPKFSKPWLTAKSKQFKLLRHCSKEQREDESELMRSQQLWFQEQWTGIGEWLSLKRY